MLYLLTGVTHCSGETFPGSYSAGGTSGGESGKKTTSAV